MSENEKYARPRCDFIYTKNSARPRSDFMLQRIFKRDDVTENGDFTIRKQRLQGTHVFRYIILSYCFLSTQRMSSEKSDPILSTQRTFKRDDVTENGDFTIRKQRLQGTHFFRYLILSYFIYTNNFLRKSRIIQ